MNPPSGIEISAHPLTAADEVRQQDKPADLHFADCIRTRMVKQLPGVLAAEFRNELCHDSLASNVTGVGSQRLDWLWTSTVCPSDVGASFLKQRVRFSRLPWHLTFDVESDRVTSLGRAEKNEVAQSFRELVTRDQPHCAQKCASVILVGRVKLAQPSERCLGPEKSMVAKHSLCYRR
jgi:hypothetical protein